MTFQASLGDAGAEADAALAAADTTIANLDTQIAALTAEINTLQAQIDLITGGGPVDPPPVGNVLRYRPPTLTSPITIAVTGANSKIDLGANQDANITIGTLIDVPGGVQILGGRRIKVIGGEIGFTQSRVNSTYPSLSSANRALYLKAKSGTTGRREVFLEGLLFSGSQIAEGINMDCAGMPTTLTMQNIRFTGDLVGSLGGNHSDAFQCWNGPEKIQIDGFEVDHCFYQGIFLEQTKFGTHTMDNPAVEIYRAHIVQESTAEEACFWSVGAMIGSDNYVRTNAKWTADPSKGLLPLGKWPMFTPYTGTPRVPTILNAGANYVSPGYVPA